MAERQQQHGWGKSIVETLARDLQKEFAGMSEFSSRNRWYMRDFYLEYSADELLQPLVAEISWAKHLLIMTKCKSSHERLFYTEQTRRNNWTKSVLAQQIKARAYDNTVLAQQNFADTLPAAQLPAAVLPSGMNIPSASWPSRRSTPSTSWSRPCWATCTAS